MGRNYEVVSKKGPSPFLPVVGFVLMVALGAVSYFLSPIIVNWMQTTHVVIGATGIQLLPMALPATWSPLGKQLLISAIMFLVSFTIAMVVLFMFMRPGSAGEYDVSLGDMRKDKERRRHKRGY